MVKGWPTARGRQEGGVGAAHRGGQGGGQAQRGGGVWAVGVAVRTDLFLLPPLGPSVLEPDLQANNEMFNTREINININEQRLYRSGSNRTNKQTVFSQQTPLGCRLSVEVSEHYCMILATEQTC